jgi:hypothetical protein
MIDPAGSLTDIDCTSPVFRPMARIKATMAGASTAGGVFSTSPDSINSIVTGPLLKPAFSTVRGR